MHPYCGKVGFAVSGARSGSGEIGFAIVRAWDPWRRIVQPLRRRASADGEEKEQMA